MKEETEKEQNYTEYYNGIIMLRKGILEDKEMWFGTVGNQLVSDGAFESKEKLVENLNNITIERICKIVAGAFARAIELSTENKKQ